ncbi:hypothetical protein ACC870_38390, partial [Rhizobium ruizarguesonis]
QSPSLVRRPPCFVSFALQQLLEAGAAHVIPSNSDKLLRKIGIPEIPHPNPLPWRLGEIPLFCACRPILIADFIKIAAGR